MIVTSHDPRFNFEIRDKSLSDQQVVREIWCENVYEVVEGDFSDTGITVDIGANIGSFSVLAGHYGKKVYAIEPEPNNIKLLRNNIKMNDMSSKIEVVQFGISDFNGKAIISNEDGGSTIKDNKEGTEIKIITIQQLWKNLNLKYIDVLKIDIEGSEVEVILSSPKFIMEYCRYITVEFDSRAKDNLGKMVNKLSETHQMKVVGSWERGGMIFARRY